MLHRYSSVNRQSRFSSGTHRDSRFRDDPADVTLGVVLGLIVVLAAVEIALDFEVLEIAVSSVSKNSAACEYGPADV